jgi:hypothetical protein
MRNKQIDGLTTNHSHAPLLEQEQLQVLDANEIKSSFKVDLKDVLWWMSIKNARGLEVLVIIDSQKEGASP